MTKWQESCITALASSPFAWEAFKMKQRNKNLLWQYINRIWPYHRIVSTNKKLSKDSQMINELNRLLVYLKAYNMESNCSYNFSSAIDFIITDKDMMSIKAARLLPDSARNIYDTNRFNVTLTGGNMVSGTTDIIKLFANQQVGDHIHFNAICGNMSRPKEQIKNCIHGIKLLICTYNSIYGTQKETELIKKKIKTLNWLNIGIEIEHDALNETSKKIVKRILQQNCVEYDSGYDGGMRSRLRENRIRLNGIKGLKGLYTLLQDMQENAAIADNSSVHMHIDCKFDNSYERIKSNVNNMVNEGRRNFTDLEQTFIDIILSYEILEEFVQIFDLHKISCISDFERWVDLNGIIRFNNEFNTVEYRFCIPNFNYSDYVIQILFLIHITECIKHNSRINKNYVTMLYRIMNSIRN